MSCNFMMQNAWSLVEGRKNGMQTIEKVKKKSPLLRNFTIVIRKSCSYKSIKQSQSP